MLYALAIVNIC